MDIDRHTAAEPAAADDPAIRSLNPGFATWRVPPAQRIEVVVFGVAIGVTQILKQSLAHFDAAFGPQLGEGAEPMWPNVSVTFQNDSRRMLAYVLATPYTIGCSEGVSYLVLVQDPFKVRSRS